MEVVRFMLMAEIVGHCDEAAVVDCGGIKSDCGVDGEKRDEEDALQY